QMANRSPGLWIGRTHTQATHELMPHAPCRSCASIPWPASRCFSGLAHRLSPRGWTPERDGTLLCLGWDCSPTRSGSALYTATAGTDSCAPLDQYMEGTGRDARA